MMSSHSILVFANVCLLLILGVPNHLSAAPIRNVILCIGDGMGPEQVKAARLYAGTNLFFESFPYRTIMETASASSTVTDSAAGATAMATGIRVNNGVISLKLPGDGSELETLLEYFKGKGKSTGLVATAYITHATPAAFGAHETSRYNTNEIADDYLNQTKPNVLFGGGGNGMVASNAIAAGYTVVTDTNELFALDTDVETFVSGQFGSGVLPYEVRGVHGNLPHLHQMVQVALDILDNDPDGFFLMIEGSAIDLAGHGNYLAGNIHETIEFANSVKTVADWMGDRQDTLLLVTADHETGGLVVTNDNGAGNYPDVTWSTTGHTDTPVPVYGIGLNANLVTNVVANTNIYAVAISSALVQEVGVSILVDSNGYHMTWTSASNDIYELEYVSDLISATNWQSWGTVTSVSSRLTITDTNLLDSSKFYRLISKEAYNP